MAKRVKIYGSPQFNNAAGQDLPAGVSTVEHTTSTEVWAGCLNTCVPTTDGVAYTSPHWRTATSWSSGGYFRSHMDNGNWGSGPGVLVDSNKDSGWEVFTNWANNNKHCLMRAGKDLDDNVLVDYVRVWVFMSQPQPRTKLYWMEPGWYVAGSAGNQTGYETTIQGGAWSLDSSNRSTWRVDNAFSGKLSSRQFLHSLSSGIGGRNQVRQRSVKWTTSPVAGRNFTGEVVKHTGWGIRMPTPGPGHTFYLESMAVEVGFDDAPVNYLVTTGPATPAVTSAQLTGSVDPQGDTGGKWFFKWGLLPDNLDNESTEEDQPSSTLYNVILGITGLSPDVTYWYQLVARDSEGSLHFGNILSFRTVTTCSVNPTSVA
jgi:hypothetical protein